MSVLHRESVCRSVRAPVTSCLRCCFTPGRCLQGEPPTSQGAKGYLFTFSVRTCWQVEDPAFFLSLFDEEETSLPEEQPQGWFAYEVLIRLDVQSQFFGLISKNLVCMSILKQPVSRGKLTILIKLEVNSSILSLTDPNVF